MSTLPLYVHVSYMCTNIFYLVNLFQNEKKNLKIVGNTFKGENTDIKKSNIL